MISTEPRNLGRISYLSMDYPPVKAANVFSGVLYKTFPKTKRFKDQEGNVVNQECEDAILYADFLTDDNEVIKELKEVEQDVQKHLEENRTAILPKRNSTPPAFSSTFNEQDNRVSVRIIVPSDKKTVGCQDEEGNVVDFQKIKEALESRFSEYTADLAIVPENMWLSMGKYGVKLVARGIKLRKATPEMMEAREKQSGPKRGPVFL